MAGQWTWRVAVAVLLGGGLFAGLAHFGLVPAILDADAHQGAAVETASGESLSRPLELSPVDVTEVQPAMMAERLRVSGELRPVNRVSLKAKVGGTVLEVNARAGEAVRAGDVLVRLETEDLEAALVQRDSNLDAARAQLVLAQQTLQKTEELAGRGFATRAALDKARSDVSAALANVQGLSAQSDTARTALRDAELIAPFDGIVSLRAVEPGEPAGAGAELLAIVDISVLEAQVLVATRDIARLKVGQVAELEIDGLEGQKLMGTVDRINPVANEGSRFVPVHIRLENTDGRLWGGMFATGSILVREAEDVLVVPETALRRDDAGSFVLKLQDGRLLRQAVETGARWNGGRMVEIAQGLAPGDTVVTAPLPELRPDTAAIVARAG